MVDGGGCIIPTVEFHLDNPAEIWYFPHSNGEVPEWSKGADCKSVGAAFEGSNPSLPIKPSLIAEKAFFVCAVAALPVLLALRI